MCKPSIISNDWVTKGCHIHVEGIELKVYPDHRGGLGFKSVFSLTDDDRANGAIKVAYEKCLPDPNVRERWIKRLESARLAMLSQRGDLYALARGRMAEFNFLGIAIRRWTP